MLLAASSVIRIAIGRIGSARPNARTATATPITCASTAAQRRRTSQGPVTSGPASSGVSAIAGSV
jgi:hypothetical protein